MSQRGSRCTVLFFGLVIILAGCVTEVAPDLPMDALPVLEAGESVQLLASPNHEGSGLPGRSVAAGQKLTLIGRDESASSLLVFDGKRLGWFPAFFSASDIADVESVLTISPLPAECGRYLGSLSKLAEEWTAPLTGPVIIYGALYREKAGGAFRKAVLSVQAAGSGKVIAGDYVHVPLTTRQAIIVFAFALDGVSKGTEISLRLADAGRESTIVQAAFFSNLCRDRLPLDEVQFTNALPVGQEKGYAPQWVFAIDQSGPEPDATPRVIHVTVGEGRCPTSYTTRLKSGDRTWAISDGKLNLRIGPGTANRVAAQVQPGESLMVLRGPRCANNMFWWEVQLESGEQGWVSEGDAEEYFLGPQQSAAQPAKPAAAAPPASRQAYASNAADFSGQQGGNGWKYLREEERNKGIWHDMQFDGACWRSGGWERDVRICGNGEVHPGQSGRVAFEYRPNFSGPIRLEVHAHKIDTRCGDGIWVGVEKVRDGRGLEERLDSFRISGGDNAGITRSYSTTVDPGNLLYVMVDIHGNSTCDQTRVFVNVFR